MPKRIYLASPYGFSAQQRKDLLPVFVRTLESLGAEVWEPFQHSDLADRTAPGWAYRVGQKDLQAVVSCDAIFGIVNGCPPDEGVMVELGAAIALKKPTFLFRDDFRKCAPCENYPLNLMLFTGLPAVGWEDYFYTAVDEIGSPRKALVRWLQGSLA
jgi:nucleoside 2-deoxyribosyltransferase